MIFSNNPRDNRPNGYIIMHLIRRTDYMNKFFKLIHMSANTEHSQQNQMSEKSTRGLLPLSILFLSFTLWSILSMDII